MPTENNRELVAKVASCQLIAKCIASVRRGDISGLTPNDFSKALHELAIAWQQETGEESYYQAYSHVMQSPEGLELYRGLTAAQGT